MPGKILKHFRKMKLYISERFATNGLLLLLSVLVVFHGLILLRIIPFEMIWGGRLKDASEMVSFESISILVNLLMLSIVAIKGNLLKINIHPGILKVALWAMFGLFLLNTIGNFLSINWFEKAVFAPITLVLSLFCLRLASAKPSI
jgi:hypothetical protein